jgi:DNA-binding Lrp family transcriptional regulator
MFCSFSNLLYEIRRIGAVTVKKIRPQVFELLVRKVETKCRNHYVSAAKFSEIVKFFRNFNVVNVEKMDDTDKAIIELLKYDGRATYSDIGKRIGLSEGAIRKRMKALVDSGAIRRFTVKVGLTEGAEAIALLSVDPSLPTSEVSQALKKFSNIETVYEITGEYDIAVTISGLNITEVNECLEKIRRLKGVANTNTMIVLRSW